MLATTTADTPTRRDVLPFGLRTARRRPWTAAALAAALLVAAGLHWWPTADASGTPAAASTVIAAGPIADATPRFVPVPDSAAPSSVTPVLQAPTAPATRAGTRAAARPSGLVASNGRARNSRAAGHEATSADAERSPLGAALEIATVQHLGQAEVLLTSFRAEPPRDSAAPALQGWARELLTTTRLLLDSPAARDPRLGPLLGELEPVLVQIVQLPAARQAEERLLIARSLEQSDLMSQLRAVVPAGPVTAQRAGE